MVRHTGEDLIDMEGVAVATMLTLHAAGINGAEFDAPEADGFPADNDAALSQEIFGVSMAQVVSREF